MFHHSVFFLCALTCFIVPLGASAQQAFFVHPTQHDVTTISDIELSQIFYGELTDAPHTYTFTISEPTTVYAEILVPDIDSTSNDKSGLILESLPNDGGVREIQRLPAKDAAWEAEYEWGSGDSYRHGPSYYDSLEVGTYLLEVSTPINQGKYVLAVGKREDSKGYFNTVKDIAQIKTFFGKSKIALLQSPLVSVPLILLLVLLYIGYRFMGRRLRIQQ